MKFIADFHVHSHYSAATGRDCNPENLYRWAVYKGLTVVGTGDFTHPAWREELRTKLELADEGEGLYRLKDEPRKAIKDELIHELVPAGEVCVRFVISGEISTIYKKNGKTRKVHHLILLPSLDAAEQLSRRLEEIGNLRSDGRPILGLDSRYLLEMTLEACPEALFIPAHIWTPHFSLFGANSGFDHIEECFEDLTHHIYALETGLSSDPPMNWRLSALDGFALVSNSDAHSPRNLAREANIFDTDLSFPALRAALKDHNPDRFMGTLEFFPEEGKYHYDGHRGCGIRWNPSATRAAGGICPVCGQKVTVGVLHRVEELADREEGVRPAAARYFESLVPLPQLIASAFGVGEASRRVQERYLSLIRAAGSELTILRDVSIKELAKAAGPLIAESIRRVREGKVKILPGFDGEYGRIEALKDEERHRLSGQAGLFDLNLEPVSILPSYGASREFLDSLNQEQVKAVTAEAGPLIIIAGPGTGKTRTLTHRIAYLILEKGIDPASITAVTFTNKAADEMRVRLGELLRDGAYLESLTVGTFHAICLDILRHYKEKPTPVVLDDFDSRAVLEEVLHSRGSRKGAMAPREAARQISFLKSHGLLPSAPEVPEEIRPIYQAYQEQLNRYRALDYDDILLEVVNLFKEAPPVGEELSSEGGPPFRSKYSSRFTHLLVDEFQDVNAVQYQLVKLWAGDGRDLFVIGDPDQAIYGFRGADHRYFRRLQEDFPGSNLIKLAVNYRSVQSILTGATALISNNPGRLEPELELVAHRGGGPKIRHMEAPGDTAEGIAVVREIGRLIGGTTMLQAHGQGGGRTLGDEPVEAGEGRGFSDIAVLFRTGRQADKLEECFLKEGIPYRVVGQKSFLEEREVRAALTFFRCVLDPFNDFYVLTCLASPRFDLRPSLLAALAAKARDRGFSVMEAISPQPSSFAPEVTGKLQAFINAVDGYRDRVLTGPVESLLVQWIEENGLRGEQSMERLLRVALRAGDLPSFMARIVLNQEADYERLGKTSAGPEAVSLMTIHAAKGLEFPVVFITGVEDGLIPLRDGGDEARNLVDLEEERRLFYVGLTRAKDELILTSARKRTRFGVSIAPVPSPFLDEIPGEYLRRDNRWENGKLRGGDGGKRQDKQLSLF